jgi:hypothetical protein
MNHTCNFHKSYLKGAALKKKKKTVWSSLLKKGKDGPLVVTNLTDET